MATMKITVKDLRDSLLWEQQRIQLRSEPRIEFPAKQFLMPYGSVTVISFGSLPALVPQVDRVVAAHLHGTTVTVLGELRWRDATWLFRMTPSGEFPGRWVAPDPGMDAGALVAMVGASVRPLRRCPAVFRPPSVEAPEGAVVGLGGGDPALDLKSRIVAALRTLSQPGLAAEAEQFLGGDYAEVLRGALGLLERPA